MVWLRQALLEDEELGELIANVYSVWAEEDAEFPYIVYRLDNDYTPGGYVANGTLYVDVWDYAQIERRALQIRGHVIRLLDRKIIQLRGVSCARLWLQTDGWVAEEARNIWHRAIQFVVRYDRRIELDMIRGRDA